MKNNIINEEFFNNINTEIKAYLLGFYAADGYISISKTRNIPNYRVGIQNSIDDIEVLEMFNKYICPNHNINIKEKSEIKKAQGHLRWTSKIMCNKLSEIGLGERKTLNFNFNLDSLQEDLKRHFIRGYFDGDGSFSCNNIIFSTNKLDFTNLILEEFKKLSKLINGIIYTKQGKTCEYYTLRLNFKGQRYYCVEIIYDYFYKNSNFFLSRKKEQFEYYLNTVLNK